MWRTVRQVEGHDDSRGLVLAFAAYGLWGFFPLYFHLLAASGSVEIVAHRIAWTLVFCLIGVTVRRNWASVRAVVADRRLVGSLVIAGCLVSVNWLMYIYAVVTDHVVDAALGYFMNPLVTVVFALIFLRERLRPRQAVALGLGLVSVLVMAIGAHRVPWLGLGLAVSFGLYSLLKNRVGHRASPLAGLGIETVALAPVSFGYILWLGVMGRGTFTTLGPGYAVLLAMAGLVTAVPLLFFAAGAARLSLVSLALVQYITPTMQFAIGVLVFDEHMPPARWVGFFIIWAALVVLTWDVIRRVRHDGSGSPAEASQLG